MTIHYPKLFVLPLLWIVTLTGHGTGTADEEAAPASPREQQQTDRPASVRPEWRVGDSWIVETQTRLLPARRDPGSREQGEPVRWQFQVQKTEKIGGQPCFLLEIRSLLKGRPQPVTRLWVIERSLAVRQLQTQLPTPAGLQTVTESYQFMDENPSPVQSPLTALPLDMPVFLDGRAKGVHVFRYKAVAGPHGQKGLGDTTFAFSIEQRLTPVQAAEVKDLVPVAFEKGVRSEPLFDVKLKTSHRAVRQIWRRGMPWPIYANNGSTVSRLVQFTPAR